MQRTVLKILRFEPVWKIHWAHSLIIRETRLITLSKKIGELKK